MYLSVIKYFNIYIYISTVENIIYKYNKTIANNNYVNKKC